MTSSRKTSVQILSVALVVHVHVRMRTAGSDGEAIQAVVRLRPPPVEDREIEASIQHNFFGRWSRKLRAGGAELFNQTSTPCTRNRPTLMS